MAAVESEVAGKVSSPSGKKQKTEYIKVTMTDGREVEFPSSRKLQKQSFIPGIDGYTGPPLVRLDFSNGETRQVQIPGGAILSLLLGQDVGLGETIEKSDSLIRHFMQAACHGYEQKLGDEMAYQPKKDEPEPTLEDKIEWVDQLISRLNSLEWSVAREGNGGLAGAGILVQALVALSGNSKEQVRSFLKPLSREQQAALKRASPVKEKIEEIEAELAKKNGVDGGALFAMLASGQVTSA